MSEITCEIKEHIGVLSENPKTGWKTEANIVSWNGGPAKIDIRDWSADHERMSRGITLTEEQAKTMTKALVERYRNMEVAKTAPNRDDMAR